MATHIVPDDDGKGFTIVSIHEDVEYVDPIKYFSARSIESKVAVLQKMEELEMPNGDNETMKKNALKNAIEISEEHIKEIMATEVPAVLFALLKSNSKGEQIKLLKGLQLTPENLTAFIFRAFTEQGWTYSEYHCQQYPKGTTTEALPRVATLDRETGRVTTSGETTLADTKIKQIIEQRRAVSVKFLDNGSEWHCFFITYRSIGGEESWRDGQPHYHYISDKFGIPRDEAVIQFKGDKYPSTNVHIELLGYGKQPDKASF